jgi:hypothetical protein
MGGSDLESPRKRSFLLLREGPKSAPAPPPGETSRRSPRREEEAAATSLADTPGGPRPEATAEPRGEPARRRPLPLLA